MEMNTLEIGQAVAACLILITVSVQNNRHHNPKLRTASRQGYTWEYFFKCTIPYIISCIHHIQFATDIQ